MFIHILCNLHDPKFALNITVICRMFCLLVLTNEVNLTNTNYNLKTSMEVYLEGNLIVIKSCYHPDADEDKDCDELFLWDR